MPTSGKAEFERVVEQPEPALDRGALLPAAIDAYSDGNFDAAVSAARRALEAAPGDPAALLVLAHAGYRLKDWETAAAAASEFLKTAPCHSDALAIAAIAWSRLGRWDDAARVYRQLSTRGRRKRRIAAVLARALAWLEAWGEWAGRYRDLLAADRRRSGAQAGLAHVLANNGQWPEAAEISSAELAARATNPNMLRLALRAEIRIGKPDDSLKLWTSLARDNPRELVRWVRILDRQKRFDWAAVAFLGLVAGRANPFDLLAEHNRLTGSLLRQAADARAAGKAALAARATAAVERIAAAARPLMAAMEGQAPYAISVEPSLLNDTLLAGYVDSTMTEKLSEKTSGPGGRSDPPWMAELTAIEEALERAAFDEASTAIDDLARRFPDKARVRQMRRRVMRARIQAARTAFALNRPAEVLTLLADADVEPASRQEALTLLARSFSACGQHMAALERLRALVEIAPENVKAWVYIARCCKTLGLWEEGRAAAARKLELEPDDPKMEILRAELEWKLTASKATP